MLIKIWEILSITTRPDDRMCPFLAKRRSKNRKMDCRDHDTHACANKYYHVNLVSIHHTKHLLGRKLKMKFIRNEYESHLKRKMKQMHSYLRNACSGIFPQKSSDDAKRPCWSITTFFFPSESSWFGVFCFELHRNTVRL